MSGVAESQPDQTPAGAAPPSLRKLLAGQLQNAFADGIPRGEDPNRAPGIDDRRARVRGQVDQLLDAIELACRELVIGQLHVTPAAQALDWAAEIDC